MADAVRRDGKWWQDAGDGRWLVWREDAGTWIPVAGPPPPPEVAGTSPVSRLGTFALEHAAKFLAIAGLLVYAVVRFAHDEFYGQMAVTPEEVGLDQTLILSRAALYLFLAGIAMVTLVAVIPSWIGLAQTLAAGRDPSEAGRIPRLPARVIGSGLLAVLLLGAILADMGRLPEVDWVNDSDLHERPHWFISQTALTVVFVVATAAAVAAFAAWWIRDSPRKPSATTLRSFLAVRLEWLVGAASVTFVLAAFVVSGRFGYVRADQAQAGSAVVPGPLTLLSVRADPVCVEWPGSDVPAAIENAGPRPFMYLGQANGVLVLYDNDQGAPLRLPAGKAVLRIAHRSGRAVGCDVATP